MSLRHDRVLSQTWRYAMHRRTAPTQAEALASLDAYIGFYAQFDPATQHTMSAVYYSTLHGRLFEDRRTRGRNS